MLPGQPFPQGAFWDGEGVNFALSSEDATGVELCLFDHFAGEGESHRLELPECTEGVRHGYLPGIGPGQLYGYRVYGPYEPDKGLWFNPAKLLIDPYAYALTHRSSWNESLFTYRTPLEPFAKDPDPQDSGPWIPKGVVVDHSFDWEDDEPPGTPWHRSVIYECHVRGMAVRHPGVPEEIRGTYLGMASEPVIEHLLSLGVTAVELQPVHQFIDEHHLVIRGLSNYWGYSPVAYFAPEVRYATSSGAGPVREFKEMVKALHRAGLEVILDVVYNHSGEGNHLGPTAAFRGVDNLTYYRVEPERPGHYKDFTGTGNSLNIVNPRVLSLVIESLRYWVGEMHVDGFRFDLATVLGRDQYEFSNRAPFFAAVQEDPLLSRVKLIAEPWDLADGGYQIGSFPPGWREWNDRYRDCIRRFWRGDPGQIPELATRLFGSSDIYDPTERGPSASINFVTCHDGFTLNDLVSYAKKHNEANGEDDGDGSEINFSHNWGEEGPTDSPLIVQIRERMKRNFLATLIFSQGVPMILGGDEIGRTQHGNNNAYCQDNEIGWVSWDLKPEDEELLEFTRRALEIYRANPVFRRRIYLGVTKQGKTVRPVRWIRPDGRDMTRHDWADKSNHLLGMLLLGGATDEVDTTGRPVPAGTLLMLLNGSGSAVPFRFPSLRGRSRWEELLNTAAPPSGGEGEAAADEGEKTHTTGINLAAHSLALLRRRGRSA